MKTPIGTPPKKKVTSPKVCVSSMPMGVTSLHSPPTGLFPCYTSLGSSHCKSVVRIVVILSNRTNSADNPKP